MEIYFLAAAIFVAFTAFAFFVHKKFEDLKKPEDDSSQRLMLDVIENLRKEVNHQGGESRKETMKTLELLENKFANLNDSVDQKLTDNTKKLDARLDGAAREIAKVSGELGKMAEIRSSVESLTNFLKHSKRRGNLGEEGLKEMLAEALPQEKWGLQYQFSSGEAVDAVIKTKNGIIPVDSKFPLENFDKMRNSNDDKAAEGFRKEFGKDVKKHVDAIAKKYIKPEEGTTDFAVMYLPAESIYNEASENAEVSKYARSKNIQLVSPNSFFYFLRVVLIAFQSEKFEENAKKVLSLIAGVKTEAGKFGENLSVLNKHIGNAKTKMDEVAGGYTRLEGKIDRVGEYSDALPLAEVAEEDKGGKLPLE
ncbi:DNA recombination protein RmuC [Candidatus Gracilibacteria bacterium]|nr:DNA recombination protein RmuC [Candidatus Gracilibacteria bacterium]MCF7856161.1 DNA recombination protein RmuC [Candidatus Gracilibacteria bacterium]MCF7896627.1 DNA recombination protein RmuC [Candidatus Gracilibacteria bacterium]